MKNHILIGGIIGQSEIRQSEIPGFTGVIPTGGYFGWADNMGFIGVIYDM